MENGKKLIREMFPITNISFNNKVGKLFSTVLHLVPDNSSKQKKTWTLFFNLEECIVVA